MCTYAMCVSQLPAYLSRSSAKSKVFEQQNYYFSLLKCIQLLMRQNEQNCTLLVTCATSQILFCFWCAPSKKKKKSWEMMASYLLCNELINAMHYQYAYNPYRQNHNLIHFDAHKSGDKTY